MSSVASASSNVPSNWMDWFKSRESGISIDKSNQEKLFSTFSSDISKNDCIDAVQNHSETVYLHKVNFGEKNVALFHHLVTAGGTIYDSSSKAFGLIQGLGKATAVSMTPNIETLFNVKSQNAIQVPKQTNVFNVSTAEQIDALTVSNRNSFKPRNFVPVPPFLVSSVHAAILKSGGDAHIVLLDCLKEIKNFDNEYANDQEYVDKAKEKSKPIADWLYLVSQKHEAIEAIQMIGCNNEKVANALVDITNKCLNVGDSLSSAPKNIFDQMEKSLKRPFEVLAASSSSTNDFMEKLTQLQSQTNEKASKSFKKIPTKYQNMILVAVSTSEVTLLNYDAEGAEFFKCSNCLNANVLLNSLMEAEGIECSVSSAVTTALLYGSFLWKDTLSPSGFAASVLSSESNIFRSDTLHEGMVLDYSTKFEMSEASLNKLTKTQVMFPSDLEELLHRIRGFHVLACFFFKQNGFLSQGLKKVVNFCMDNKSVLKTRIYLDEFFIPKFLCAIDERVYQWLKQCSVQKSIIDTDLSLIDFSSLLSDVLLNRFNYLLPPSIAKITTDSSQQDENQKKKKGRRDSSPVMVKNNSMNEEWKLRPNESWETVYRGKTKEGPMLSFSCKPCLKFHGKGICYEDCSHKASHCNLVGEDKELTNNFIKSLRGE